MVFLVWWLDIQTGRWSYQPFLTFDEAWDSYSQRSDDIAVLDYEGNPVLATKKAQEVIHDGEDWFTGA